MLGTAFHGLNSMGGGPSTLLSATAPGLAQYWPGTRAEWEAQMSEGRCRAEVMSTAEGREGRSHPGTASDVWRWGVGRGGPSAREHAWGWALKTPCLSLLGPRDGVQAARTLPGPSAGRCREELSMGQD